MRGNRNRILSAHDVMTSLDAARLLKPRKSINLADIGASPKAEKLIEMATRKEHLHYLQRREAYKRSLTRYRKAQQKFADLIEKNKRVMELRFKLGKEWHQWQINQLFPQSSTDGREQKTHKRFLNSVKLTY